MNSKFKVLVFKAECKQHPDNYNLQLTAAGFKTYMIPVIDFFFSAMPEIQEKILHPENYSGIIFTSERSVEAVANVLGSSRKSLMSRWKSHFVLCTGWATRDKIGRELDLIATMGEKQREEGIVDILTRAKDSIKKPILIPCGELAYAQDTLRSALEKNEIKCDVVIVYATAANPLLKAIMTQILLEDEFDPTADATSDVTSGASSNATSDWKSVMNAEIKSELEAELKLDIEAAMRSQMESAMNSDIKPVIKVEREYEMEYEMEYEIHSEARVGTESKMRSAIESVTQLLLVFFSPSGFNAAYEVIQNTPEIAFVLGMGKFVAIGPTTAAAIREKGIPVWAEAEEPNALSLLIAIHQALGTSGT